jgi:hypothetical protein
MFRERESHLGVCGGALTPYLLLGVLKIEGWMPCCGLLLNVTHIRGAAVAAAVGIEQPARRSPILLHLHSEFHTRVAFGLDAALDASRCFFSNHRCMKHVSIEAKSKIAGMLQQEMEFLTFFVLGTRMFDSLRSVIYFTFKKNAIITTLRSVKVEKENARLELWIQSCSSC